TRGADRKGSPLFSARRKGGRMDPVRVVALADLAAERAASGRLYLEFLRTSALSGGLYELPAGAVDPQRPHTEDEVYYVVRGRASFEGGGEDRAVAAGSVIFVKA